MARRARASIVSRRSALGIGVNTAIPNARGGLMMRRSTHLLLDEKHEGRQGGTDDLIGCGNAFHARADAQRHQTQQRYTPEATTWVKIKNRQYSQAVGRQDFFDRRKARVL